jgi:Zn-dependent peptidase ImmA (M78 family)
MERLAGIPVSGSTHWARGCWLIVLNESESIARQRFSLFHELKHVLDHQHIGYLYPSSALMSSHDRAEQMADYFAACVLMPKRWVKRDFGDRIQEPGALARRYGTSQMAMKYRLNQLGLVAPSQRCEWYERQLAEVA